MCRFLSELPGLRSVLRTDVEAAYEGDPAAKSFEEIILAYPCLEAIAIQRMAHVLYSLGIPFIPRMMTEWAHSKTGIDIHPGAQIGTHFFIDHGTGVVVGETCVIRSHVKLYHGVTLGDRTFPKDDDGNLQITSRLNLTEKLETTSSPSPSFAWVGSTIDPIIEKSCE